jgi:hypothetical protein
VGEYVAAFFLKSLFLTKQAFLFSSGAAQSLRFVSPPFFSNPSFLSWGYFFYRFAVFASSVRRL